VLLEIVANQRLGMARLLSIVYQIRGIFLDNFIILD